MYSFCDCDHQLSLARAVFTGLFRPVCISLPLLCWCVSFYAALWDSGWTWLSCCLTLKTLMHDVCQFFSPSSLLLSLLSLHPAGCSQNKCCSNSPKVAQDKLEKYFLTCWVMRQIVFFFPQQPDCSVSSAALFRRMDCFHNALFIRLTE